MVQESQNPSGEVKPMESTATTPQTATTTESTSHLTDPLIE
jgi:hypothetical protein